MKKGFTLVELLVVIAIIGLLSTVAVVSLGSARSKARDTKRIADIKQIMTAFQLYYENNGVYPNTGSTGSGALNCAHDAYAGYCLGYTDAETCYGGIYPGCTALNDVLAPYMSKFPKDPENAVGYYGDAYSYQYEGSIGTAIAPWLVWIMEKQTNTNICMGGYSAQWGAEGRNRWYCVLPLPT